jgi:hypothetical protein
MNPKSEKPLRLFVNPFAIWTDLAFKTAHALWASAHAAAVRANTTANVAVIPTADAPRAEAQPPATPAEQTLATAHAGAPRNAKVAVLPAADAPPRKARAAVRQPSKAVRFRATRAKVGSKANAKRRGRR